MLKRRVIPKPRSSSGHKIGNTTKIITSKHFQSQVKVEDPHIKNNYDEKMSSAAPVTDDVKEEEEEESEEEEDDWEEVEGE